MSKNERLEAALLHVKRGWKIIPLHNPTAEGKCSCLKNNCQSVAKHPRVKDWKTAASSDEKQVKKWWSQWPDANIGIPMGSTNGIITLDIDGSEGYKIVEKNGAPKTCTVITTKGRHLYFKHPGENVSNPVKNWPDIDCRGDGGYVVAPGSKHASGQLYHWAEGLSPEEIPPANAPGWWLDSVIGNGRHSQAPSDAHSTNGNGVKGHIVTGKRNSTLASLAGVFRDKGLSVEAIQVALLDYNRNHCDPPLDEKEVCSIATSYGRYEEGNPNKRLTVSELANIIKDKQKFLTSPIDKVGIGVNLMLYRNGVYNVVEGFNVARRMIDSNLGMASRPDTINTVIELLKERTKIDEELLNPSALDLINVQNGMLDWKQEKITSHDSELLSTFQVQAEYKPEAKSEILDNFLTSIFPPDTLQLAEEIIGYLMIPTTKYQKAFMLVGEGANGKSTFLNMLLMFLGKHNISRISLQQLEDSTFASSELQGKLANIYPDLPGVRLEKSDVFKSIVGGDAIKAERKYGQPFILQTTARLLFSTNFFPKSNDSTFAFFRRWIIIPFPNKFEGAKANTHLLKELTRPEVLSALLNRALIGLKRLEENQGFSESESTREKEEAYKIENDSTYEYIKEKLEYHEGSRLKKIDIWTGYLKWCGTSGIQFPKSQSSLNKMITGTLNVQAIYDIKTKAKCWGNTRWREEADKVSGSQGHVDDKY